MASNHQDKQCETPVITLQPSPEVRLLKMAYWPPILMAQDLRHIRNGAAFTNLTTLYALLPFLVNTPDSISDPYKSQRTSQDMMP
jgi:hypothetical protein